MPGIHQNSEEFKEPVLRARTIHMETGNLASVLSVLTEIMGEESEHRALDYKTFRYISRQPRSSHSNRSVYPLHSTK